MPQNAKRSPRLEDSIFLGLEPSARYFQSWSKPSNNFAWNAVVADIEQSEVFEPIEWLPVQLLHLVAGQVELDQLLQVAEKVVFNGLETVAVQIQVTEREDGVRVSCFQVWQQVVGQVELGEASKLGQQADVYRLESVASE